MSDALPLPPRPRIGRYEALAEGLRKACRTGRDGAIRAWAARWGRTLARSRGIALTRDVREPIDREAARVERQWRALRKPRVHASHCTRDAARAFVALWHGFTTWRGFAAHVGALARPESRIARFEAAVDAIVAGERARLEKLIAADPGLATARSTREHRSTLLHYVSANGVEDFRQRTPANVVAIAKLLLDAGADVNAVSDAYAGGSTTLGLAATSIHPQQAGVQIALLRTLLDRGSKLDQPKAPAGARSIVRGCFANGQPAAARYLAVRGAHVDLEGAAALGSLADVRRHVDGGARRGPRATRAQLASAFLYACGYGRKDVVSYLLEKGVDPAVRNDGGQTGLHWAAYGAHAAVVGLLLRRGAPVDVIDDGFRCTPLQLAVYAWGNLPPGAERDRYYKVVARLSRGGARLDPHRDERTKRDDREARRQRAMARVRRDRRMQAALRGEVPRDGKARRPRSETRG